MVSKIRSRDRKLSSNSGVHHGVTWSARISEHHFSTDSHRLLVIMNRVAIKGSRSPTAFNLKNMDLNIFKSPKMECRQTPDNIPLTERCSSLMRLCTASKYIDAVPASKLDEEDQRALMIEFNEEAYNMVLDDTIHLVNMHSDNIKLIQSEWIKNFGFPPCSVANCVKTTRHYGRGRREKINELIGDGKVDPIYDFYRSLYDRVHHFVWHLYDIGLRVDVNSLDLNVGGSDEKEAENDVVTVDRIFAAERDQVRSRRDQCQLELDRFEEENGKYTMQTIAQTKAEITLLDALIEKLDKMENIQRSVQRLRMYFQDEACDSDCIEMDVEDVADSNISELIQNEKIMGSISNFINSTKCMMFIFC